MTNLNFIADLVTIIQMYLGYGKQSTFLQNTTDLLKSQIIQRESK